MIVIVNYGMGNLGSIANMLKKLGVPAVVSTDSSLIEKAQGLILPGVGSFDSGVNKLNESGLIPVLEKKVIEEKTPILGICLGLQLFGTRSEEGKLPGLRWIDAESRRFQFPESDKTLKIPHMGWNEVRPVSENALFEGFSEPPRFYFVHSYHLCCRNEADLAGSSFYGYEFPAAIQRGNIMGTQFHPEKSHKFGMKLLANFARAALPEKC
jgi:imidazole glycerol-phosphate synthase subunit HisH